MRYDICVFGGCSLDEMYYLDNNKNTPIILGVFFVIYLILVRFV